MAIDAARWRLEQRQRMDLSLAWHIAALSRSRTLPDLSTLLRPPEARKLEGAELERRRQEFEEMKERFSIGR